MSYCVNVIRWVSISVRCNRRAPAVRELDARGNPQIVAPGAWLNRRARRAWLATGRSPAKKLAAVNEPRNLPFGLAVQA